MDPHDQPTWITVDEDCLQAWNTPEFRGEFIAELARHEWKLPLQPLCRKDGWPDPEDWAEFDDLKFDELKDGKATGSVNVYFIEVSPTGCRDMPDTTRRSGRLHFTLDLETGGVEFERPSIQRHYEPDEF